MKYCIWKSKLNKSPKTTKKNSKQTKPQNFFPDLIKLKNKSLLAEVQQLLMFSLIEVKMCLH